MENLTPAERNTLLTALNSASMQCARLIHFLDNQPFNELTNKWYSDTVNLRSEAWDAWDYVYSAVYNGSSS